MRGDFFLSAAVLLVFLPAQSPLCDTTYITTENRVGRDLPSRFSESGYVYSVAGLLVNVYGRENLCDVAA